MSQRSILHDTFVIERQYDVTPEQVYAAWTNPDAKAAWFGGSGGQYELDFRVGGREFNRATAPDGTVYTYEARCEDIVADKRISSRTTCSWTRSASRSPSPP